MEGVICRKLAQGGGFEVNCPEKCTIRTNPCRPCLCNTSKARQQAPLKLRLPATLAYIIGGATRVWTTGGRVYHRPCSRGLQFSSHKNERAACWRKSWYISLIIYKFRIHFLHCTKELHPSIITSVNCPVFFSFLLKFVNVSFHFANWQKYIRPLWRARRHW